MNREECIKELFYDYLKLGLIECDMEKLSLILTDDVTGIGIGEQGMVSSKTDVKKVLYSGAKYEENAEYNFDFKEIKVIFPTDDTANLYAEVEVQKYCGKEMSRSGFLQSLYFVRKEEKWYICGLHASVSLLNKEAIEAYPLKFAEGVMEQLRSEVKWDYYDLLNKSFSGGVLGVYVEERKFPFYFINEGMLSYLGYSLKEFVGLFQKDVSGIIYKEDQKMVLKAIQGAVSSKKDCELCCRIIKKNGELLWMAEKIRLSQDKNGTPLLLGAFLDITKSINMQKKLEEQNAVLKKQAEEMAEQSRKLQEQKEELKAQTEELTEQTEILLKQRHELQKKEKELKISEERFRIALEKTSNFIFDYNITEDEILYSDLPKKDAHKLINIGSNKENLIIGGAITEEYKGAFYKAFENINNGKQETECVIKVLMNTGRIVWQKLMMTAIKDNSGNTVRAIGVIEDITLQKETEILLTFKSEMDSMTQIFNRAAGVLKIEEMLRTREGMVSGVFVMLDIDYFKGINDTYGHPFGDEVLIETAQILKDNFRDQDIISRFGGDEFCIFFTGIRSIVNIKKKMDVISKAVSEIAVPAEGKQKVSCSIGISLCEGREKSFQKMYEEADKALYAMKENGRNGCTIFRNDEFV